MGKTYKDRRKNANNVFQSSKTENHVKNRKEKKKEDFEYDTSYWDDFDMDRGF